ncbi:MAG: hypothetical protein ABI330_14655 [Caldimonas sp.]
MRRPLDEYSFASGHTMQAVACSIILSAYGAAAALISFNLL